MCKSTELSPKPYFTLQPETNSGHKVLIYNTLRCDKTSLASFIPN